MNTNILLEYKKYLKTIKQHRILFGVIFAAIVLASIIFSYALPKTYSARCTFFVEENVISELVRGIAITPSMSAKIRVMKTAMLSREMLLEITKKLDMDMGLGGSNELEMLITRLQNIVQISLDEKRGIFSVSISHEKPYIARDFVNTLVNKYIEINTASKRDESLAATRFLKDQIELFKERMDKAEQDINEYKARMGLSLTLDIGELRREIQAAEEGINKLTIQRNHLEAKRNLLEKVPKRAAGRTITVPSPTRKRIEGLEEQRAVLAGRYSEKHPKIKQIDSELEQLRSAPDADTVQTVSDTPPEQQEDIVLQKELIDVELTSIDQRIAQLQESIEKNKRQIREIPDIQTELMELNRIKENEAIIYKQLVSRYGQSEVSKQMELEDKAMSFRIVDPAILPTTHSSPNRPAIIVAGIVFGTAGAIGFILLLGFLKGTINSVNELRATGVRVLAILPFIAKPKDRLRNLRINTAMLVLVLVPLACAGGALYLEITGSGILEKQLQNIQFFKWLRDAIAAA